LDRTKHRILAACALGIFCFGVMTSPRVDGGILDDLLRPKIPVEMDVKLGRATVEEIMRDPRIRVLAPQQYPEAYFHIHRVLDRIIASDAIRYRDSFAYDEVRIVHDDKTLNAFATAGGYIFVYTGLIRYLDAEDHLAGVLGHEIAHAELRHVSKQLEESMSTSRKLLLFQLLTGAEWANDDVVQIARQLRKLKYSRKDEAEADRYSVRYLSGSAYACNGLAGFFAKIVREGKEGWMPEWLGSHPEPDERVGAIEKTAAEFGCDTEPAGAEPYDEFKASLP